MPSSLGPVQHVPSFLFGIVLASLNDYLSAKDSRRPHHRPVWFRPQTYAMLYFGDHMPLRLYARRPADAGFTERLCWGWPGENFLTRIFSLLPLLAVGEAQLLPLHFFTSISGNLIHDSKILEKTGLVVFDPWLSYLVLVIAALLTVRFIERPGQALDQEDLRRLEDRNSPGLDTFVARNTRAHRSGLFVFFEAGA